MSQSPAVATVSLTPLALRSAACPDLTGGSVLGIVGISSRVMETEFAERVFMQKVLIIEDHADMRELLIWQVELMGYTPISAKRGRDGVEKALSEKPKLIIMDIM
ncbi:MAG TPA: response regulator, partial [Candidatus Binatia bacterium]|nr:response regulator [Candidatus Binatia bacterium]